MNDTPPKKSLFWPLWIYSCGSCCGNLIFVIHISWQIVAFCLKRGNWYTCPWWRGWQKMWPVCLRKQRSVLKGTLCWTVPSPKCNAFIISHGHRRCYLGDQLCRSLTFWDHEIVFIIMNPYCRYRLIYQDCTIKNIMKKYMPCHALAWQGWMQILNWRVCRMCLQLVNHHWKAHLRKQQWIVIDLEVNLVW